MSKTHSTTFSTKTNFKRSVLFSSLFAASSAFAVLEEILVTAQKRTESLQETPLSIEALSENDIQNKGISDITSLFSATPGVTGYEAPSSRGNISMNLRGIGSGSPNSISSDPANAIYIDGVYLGKSAGSGVDANDLERIEVLKGPQGTLYGRNSTGGAINFITKKPQDEFGLKIKVAAGNYDSKNVNARVDLPVSDDLSVALSGYSRERDDLYDNTRPGGKGFENLDRTGYRFAAQWRATDAITVDYSYSHDELDENTQALDVVGFNPFGAGVLADAGYPGNVSINSRDRINAVSATLGGLQFLPQTPEVQQLAEWMSDYIDYAEDQLTSTSSRNKRSSNDGPANSQNDVDGHSLTIAWAVEDMGAFGDVEFKSITGVREIANDIDADLDGMDNSVATGVIHELPLLTIGGLYFGQISPMVPAATQFAVAQSLVQSIQARGNAPVFNNFATIDVEQFSQELQMVGSTETIDYAVGLYYYDDEAEFRNNRTASFPIAFSATSSHDINSEAMSVYAQGTWTPADNTSWALTGGLRYTEETKDVTYLWRSSENPFGFFGGPIENNYVSNDMAETQPEVAGIYGKTFEENFSNVSGKLTLQYFINDDVNVFATYSTGYRSGGFNGDFYDTANDTADAFNEETIENFEVGLKAQFLEGQAQFNATVYTYSYDDLQISTLLPQPNGSVTASIDNAGSTKRDGLELSGKYAPFANLVLGLSYNYITGDFDDYPSTRASTLDGGAVLETSNLAQRGLSPENSITFNVDWNILEADAGNLDLSLNGSWQDAAQAINISTGVYDTNGNRLPDAPVVYQQPDMDERTLVNGRLSWTSNLKQGSLTVALWGQNLLDDEYRSFAFNYGDSLGLNIAQYGEPRTYGVDLIWEM